MGYPSSRHSSIVLVTHTPQREGDYVYIPTTIPDTPKGTNADSGKLFTLLHPPPTLPYAIIQYSFQWSGTIGTNRNVSLSAYLKDKKAEQRGNQARVSHQRSIYEPPQSLPAPQYSRASPPRPPGECARHSTR